MVVLHFLLFCSLDLQMLVSLLVTTMASSTLSGAEDFAFSTCRHFALLLASGWGRAQPPVLPPSSKYTSYPVLDGVPATVAALKHLHPQAILEAFQEVSCLTFYARGTRCCCTPVRCAVLVASQGFALARKEDRRAVLNCLAIFLDALDVITTAQRTLGVWSLSALFPDQPASRLAAANVEDKTTAPGEYLNSAADNVILNPNVAHICFGIWEAGQCFVGI